MSYMPFDYENMSTGRRFFYLICIIIVMILRVKTLERSAELNNRPYTIYYNNCACCEVDSHYIGDVVGSRIKCLPLQPIISGMGGTLAQSESNGTAQVTISGIGTYILSEQEDQIYFDEGIAYIPLNTFSSVFNIDVDVDINNKYIYLTST